jgi:squalene-hopene/tetraprenyl-beta-curcumene cyclase
VTPPANWRWDFLVSGPGRRAVAWLVIPSVACLASCRSRTEGLEARVDRALGAAMRSLIAAQSPDGAWRSPTYGVFKDGLSLSPAVLKAVAFGPDVAGSAAARRLGAGYLIARVRADGSIDDGPSGRTYPVYTASAAVMALARLDLPDGRGARAAWLLDLRRRQLTEELGWGPDDPAYGGWGYSIEPTHKADAAHASGRHVDADLSSTLFAVGALRVAGIGADDPAIRKALTFVRRCQNVAESDRDGDPRHDDGGFFFSPTDPVRNKAGSAGEDRHGRARYHSYGSATADGLRALLRCGLPPDHPRVASARRWLERHFSASSHPGTFEGAREVERDATYYYYAWSVAHAFRALGIAKVGPSGREFAWAEALARELVRRQQGDGSWSNRFTASKEDDPLVATSFAAGALGICRTFLAR